MSDSAPSEPERPSDDDAHASSGNGPSLSHNLARPGTTGGLLRSNGSGSFDGDLFLKDLDSPSPKNANPHKSSEDAFDEDEPLRRDGMNLDFDEESDQPGYAKPPDEPTRPAENADGTDPVGLFEDSDENEPAEEPKPQPPKPQFEEERLPVPETFDEVINTTLNVIPKPEGDNLVVCKFPPTMLVSCQPNVDIRAFLRANPQLLEHPPNAANLPLLYCRYADGPGGGVVSNTKLVEWEDGSYTMFVGRIPMDLEFMHEISFLVEDSKFDLKPVHAQINARIQTRFSNLLKNEYIKKNVKVKRQKMELTSLTEAISSQHTLQQNLSNARESGKHRRSQAARGLTQNFLESSDNED